MPQRLPRDAMQGERSNARAECVAIGANPRGQVRQQPGSGTNDRLLDETKARQRAQLFTYCPHLRIAVVERFIGGGLELSCGDGYFVERSSDRLDPDERRRFARLALKLLLELFESRGERRL